MKPIYQTFLAVSAAVLLTACGGGGGGGSDDAATPAEAAGLYDGTTSTGRDFSTIVLDDGRFYLLYLDQSGTTIGGVIQGNATVRNGSFTSSNAKDFNLEGAGVMNLTVSGSYNNKASLNGSASYANNGGSATFTSTYDSNYEKTPSLALISGSYNGISFGVTADETTTVTVSSSGAISGNSSNGCVFTGQTNPRSSGNVYDLSISYGSGCALAGATATGIAYYDDISEELVGVVMNSGRTSGSIFIGVKS